MSFKDVRDLAEHLKLLGFPHAFPLQALATTNGCLAAFCVVAEVLLWLADLLEPGALLAGGVQSQELRVLLVRSATEFFVTKAGIKLNPRRLYAASSVTAGELQKITRLLIAPTHTEAEGGGGGGGSGSGSGASGGGGGDEEQNYRSLNQIDVGDKMDDLRRARELSSELTQRGATLYDLLGKEAANREERLAQANRPTLDMPSLERTLRTAIAAAQLKLQASRAQLEGTRVEVNALNSKLQRKRAELERTTQRLEALQKIRPAHMQEFEECERELQTLFQQYFQRVHVRDALRAQLEARNRRVTPAPSPVLQRPAAAAAEGGAVSSSSMPFIPDGLLEDDDVMAMDDDEDNDDDDEVLDGPRLDMNALRDGIGGIGGVGVGGNGVASASTSSLLQRHKRGEQRNKADGGAVSVAGQRPGTATSRMRPTTGRSRRGGLTNRSRIGGIGGASDQLDDDDDSSFGSSDSDLDMDGILGVGMGVGVGAVGGGAGGGGAANATTGAGMLSSMGNAMGGVGDGDDDFDLNSMDDISISKLTGELPLRPKTANKQEHHSDEDF